MTKPYYAFTDYADAVWDAMNSVDKNMLDIAANTLLDTFVRNRTVYVCGNGGSAAIANHLTCDCMKGVAMDRGTGATLKVHSLACNVPLMTAIANDIGYEEVFSRQLEWLSPNMYDVLIVISSSGNSPNIVKAINTAIDKNMRVISITGFDEYNKAKFYSDFPIHIKSDNYGVIEDVSQSVMHYIAQTLRRTLSDKNPEEIKY
jgi:phosphoheptose isomerase